MIIAYTFFNIILFILSKQYYKKLLNPLSVYLIVWQLALTIHESGYLIYYPLTVTTWFVIIISQLLLMFGLFSVKPYKAEPVHYNSTVFKAQLTKYLWICTILSGIAVFSSIVLIISKYGFNLVENITNVYADRVNDNVDYQAIPYIGSFVYIGLPLSAIYMKCFGFSKWVIIQFILVFLSSLTSGARAGIVFAMFMFAFAFVYADDSFIKQRKKKSSGTIKSNMPLIISVIILLTIFILVSNKRVAGHQMTYATPMFIEHFGYNELVYKIFTYIANPVGVLNEFLKNPDFGFGQNTFLPIYNIIAKFGIIDRVEQYQAFYLVPDRCNVGTWLRELYQDFSIISFFFIYVFGYFVNIVYMKAVRKKQIGFLLMLSICMTIIGLSFFDWKLRTSSMWIALLFGYYFGKQIDKKSHDNSIGTQL